MSWRDNLVPGTYKGFPYYIKSSTRDSGRRVELKQFPNNDSPVVQDFGRDATTFTIEAYVIANKANNYDYMPDRNNLILAFDQIGVGELVHPYYGTLQVYPNGKLSISETTEEGGIAKISMPFVVVNEDVQKLILPSFQKQQANITLQGLPTESEDFNSLIDDSVDLGLNDLADSVAGIFSTGRAFGDSLKAVTLGNLQKLQRAIYKIKGGFSSLLAGATATLTGIISTIDNIVDAPCSLVSSIKAACDSFSYVCGVQAPGIFGGTAGPCSGTVRGEITELDGETIPSEMGISTTDALLDLVSEMTDDEYGFIPSSQINNVTVMNDSFKFNLISTAMKITIRTDFMDKDKAIAYTDKIAGVIETFLQRLGSETDESNYDYITGDYLDNSLTFTAMEDLRNIFIQAMYAKASLIAKMIEYTVPVSIMSTLQLAYDKYEDLDREEEIYDTNMLEIRNPGFLPNGGILRILDE